jgi:hypothetical protein
MQDIGKLEIIWMIENTQEVDDPAQDIIPLQVITITPTQAQEDNIIGIIQDPTTRRNILTIASLLRRKK